MSARSASAAKRRSKKMAAGQRATATLNGTAGPSQHPPGSDFGLVAVEDAPKRKRKAGEIKLPAPLRDRAVLHLPFGDKYTQKEHLPPSSQPGKGALETVLKVNESGKAELFGEDVYTLEEPLENSVPWFDEYKPDQPSRHRRRRLKQHQNWNEQLTPELVRSYLAHKNGIGHGDTEDSEMCKCSSRRTLNVTLGDWKATSQVSLDVCACRTAAEQLLCRGYFPCAPLSPSMAFSLDLLEFISINSLHVAPNATAWSETFEEFWGRREGPRRLKGHLRKRLSMALTWFQVLDNKAEALVTHNLLDPSSSIPTAAATGEERARKRQRLSKDADSGKEESVSDRERGLNNTSEQTSPAVQGVEDIPTGASRSTQRRTEPSARLRKKCPLCFGGARADLRTSAADVIVCIDANFSQKRRKCAEGDVPVEFIDGRFLQEEFINAMEAELAEKRKSSPRTRRKGTSAPLSEEILDGCEESFTAAQESVAKASVNYYADTGLMALLCRHDRVLWVASMKTPGERQHYALALLRQLADEVPDDWRIGLLYDIACQLSRSIEKWGLIPEIADRIVFGVSVFHAYGHQWACQIVFHPRKRSGFGLSDGEGCERFWSAIRHLIPGLRVSGSYRRLFVLNRQMQAMDDQSCWTFGAWLRRRYGEALRRRNGAAAIVKASGVHEYVLRAEWEDQVKIQLAKPQRQSARAADKIIDEILVAMGAVDELKEDIRKDRALLRKAHELEANEIQAKRSRIEDLLAEIKSLETQITTLNASIGTEHCRKLEEMRGDAYLRARVNARVLRGNIRQALQAHKFERRKLERAYRHQVLQAKDHAQTKTLVHKREKTITAQVRKFNTLVDQMVLLARQGKKPRGRLRIPVKLDSKKLFRLDVDDEIWQDDPGLGPQSEGEPRRWESDIKVKQGIQSWLEVQRCDEEMERVESEVGSLAQWSTQEEDRLTAFLRACSDDHILHGAVNRRLATHIRMRREWMFDLGLGGCALGARFKRAISDRRKFSEGEFTNVPTAERQQEDQDEGDSDDASDAYSSGEEDEDERLAEVLDELERLAVDLDINSDIDDPEDDQALESAHSDANETLEGGLTVARKAVVGVAKDDKIPDVDKQMQPLDVIVVSDDDEGDSRPERTVKKRTPGAIYQVGSYKCDDEDLGRVEGTTTWLSGSGLAVFLKSEVERKGITDVQIVHSATLLDVEWYEKESDMTRREDLKQPILRAIEMLPEKGRKWLVLGHVRSPPHWTLLEVRWTDGTIRFYDSFADRKTYAKKLEKLLRNFLQMYEEYRGIDIGTGSLRWVAEERGVRQTNSWDCGAFVAADGASLIETEKPSDQAQDAMLAWRRYMASKIRDVRVK